MLVGRCVGGKGNRCGAEWVRVMRSGVKASYRGAEMSEGGGVRPEADVRSPGVVRGGGEAASV